jgi:hypothetical protein
LGSREETIVPRGEEKGRDFPACPLGTSADEFAKYARQESNKSGKATENSPFLIGGGTQSGTLSDGVSGSALSVLLKLAAGLTPDERAVLAQFLNERE